MMRSTEIDVKIGSRIRAFRILRNITVEELGAVIGVKKQTVKRIETGRTSVTAPQLVLIAHKLETTSSILTGEQMHEEGANE